MENDLNPSVAAAVELLVAHGWRWVGRGLQPSIGRRRTKPKQSPFMQDLHSLRREEAHLL